MNQESRFQVKMDAIQFAKSLIGTLYVYYHIGDHVVGQDKGPFWAVNGPVPSPEEIRKDSCHCSGVANLMRRFVGLPVPGVEEGWEIPGGTPAWEWFIKERKWAEPFDPKKEYPDGTLLLRTYRSEYDQGHVAIKIGDYLLQSFADRGYDPADRSKLEPGVNMLITVQESQALDPEGYYQYAVDPKFWLKA